MSDDGGSSTDEVPKHDIVFEARTDDGRRITSILSSICISAARNKEAATLAWCEVDDMGMTFTVNVTPTLQAIAYVKREGVFHTWWLDDEHAGNQPGTQLEFGINLGGALALSAASLPPDRHADDCHAWRPAATPGTLNHSCHAPPSLR